MQTIRFVNILFVMLMMSLHTFFAVLQSWFTLILIIHYIAFSTLFRYSDSENFTL